MTARKVELTDTERERLAAAFDLGDSELDGVPLVESIVAQRVADALTDAARHIEADTNLTVVAEALRHEAHEYAPERHDDTTGGTG